LIATPDTYHSEEKIMDVKDLRKGKVPEVVLWERRTQKRAELSSAQVMKILRERAAIVGKRASSEVQWEADAGGPGKGTKSSR
jgi:hypothetical protein